MIVAVDSFSNNCFLTVSHQETDTGQKDRWYGTRGEGDEFIIFLQLLPSDLICFPLLKSERIAFNICGAYK